MTTTIVERVVERMSAFRVILLQTCPDEASAAAALGRLLAQADGDHFPNREATLGQALAKYLEVADLEGSTREAHEGYIRRTIGDPSAFPPS